MTTREKILAGVQNMLTKRGLGQLHEVEAKGCNAYIIDNEVLVYLPPSTEAGLEKMKNDQVHNLFFILESHGLTHAILPYDEIAHPAADILRSHKVYRVEMFPFKCLLFDPTAHKRTPPHTKLTPEQVATELPRIKPSELPRILITDVIVRFYDWSVGDVIRIDRSDGPYYRVVEA